jgi:hypothetical protein
MNISRSYPGKAAFVITNPTIARVLKRFIGEWGKIGQEVKIDS